MADVTVIGGGLAGCEAAWQLAEAIPIVKQGGISEKQDAIYLFENDSLPSENSIYIFLA